MTYRLIEASLSSMALKQPLVMSESPLSSRSLMVANCLEDRAEMVASLAACFKYKHPPIAVDADFW